MNTATESINEPYDTAGSSILPYPSERRQPVQLALVALLLVAPLAVYLSMIGQWSIDGDEMHTLIDSRRSVSDIMGYEKPIYYLICHFLLQLGIWTDEFATRLPSAIAAALLAPVYYCFIRKPYGQRAALFAGILVAAHPWVLQLSQFARFYTLMMLLSAIATFSLFTWLSDRRPRWLVSFGVFSVLATFTHTTAVVLLPAGIAACIAYFIAEQPKRTWEYTKQYGLVALAFAGVVALVLGFALRKTFLHWYGSQHGTFGNYSPFSVVAGYVFFTGVHLWAMAIIPLCKWPSRITSTQVFWTTMLFGTLIPFVLISPFGGGVAPHYLLCGTPALILLASVHASELLKRVGELRLEFCFAALFFIPFVPFAVSTVSEGNHRDYRAATQFVDSLKLENPIVGCSAHNILDYYAETDYDLFEIHSFDRMRQLPSEASQDFVGKTMYELTNLSQQTGRPLVLVSMEDRKPLPKKTSKWLSENFLRLAEIEKPRLDHRRNRLVVYQYRGH